MNLIQYTRQSVFLTGKAGTGKSTFLKYICANTKKKHVVLAPTGIAAINAGGSTLHSFFKLPFYPLLPDDPNFSLQRGRIHEFFKYTKPHRKLLEELELVIIDEISMVRADIIDFIDKILRTYSQNMREPFGGKQVLLVGDIDRGGVFAQLYGTVALLEEDERRRIKGVVVNKFRGDRAILEPGLKTLEELCGIPVAGVIPYTHVDIDDEDSLTERFGRSTERKLLDIAVIRVPRISNFTDFSPFEHYENVSLRYVDQVSDLHRPDMILLPGTKSTIADLRWLRQSGLEAAILKAADAGTLIFGVCGGYQMLGRTVSDPEQVEAAGVTEISGMGLLDMDTEFRGEKVQAQTKGIISGVEGMLSPLNGLAYEGYEIHMGRSRQEMPALSGGGNVYGSYVHGIFDAPGIADTILRTLCARKGVSFDALATFDTRGYKERQYDLLADVVRGGLDMSFVYRVLRREV